MKPPELLDIRSRITGTRSYSAFMDCDCLTLLRETELLH